MMSRYISSYLDMFFKLPRWDKFLSVECYQKFGSQSLAWGPNELRLDLECLQRVLTKLFAIFSSYAKFPKPMEMNGRVQQKKKKR